MLYNMVYAWKNEEYREQLSQGEQPQLPECPAGEVELSEAELEFINGMSGGFGGGYGGGYGFAGGIVGNSYYCGNYSGGGTTNLGFDGGTFGGDTFDGGIFGGGSRFNFSCSVSGGFGGNCIFGGK
ncbi:mersacidin/lichenicidin family type 2 lantibiotic [Ktedonobacter racemifer]|uniref:Uncharacterized protein n=1 Tax=Ktedonobacter racemifer DSM 44963 TaxID=485913 RepID=D6TJ72_KTERA|nr:mersacidin/lichenicidin family type 2 lantibiotic [Ktedonobacter racemifer]EFH89479.1 hypothetical protein Krac_11038 [Ktedonobacter racemifer DSM 44963]